MSETDVKECVPCSAKKCSSCEKGTTPLLVAAVFALYGITLYVSQGTVCTVCLIVVPFYLALGLYLRHQYKKERNNLTEKQTVSTS